MFERRVFFPVQNLLDKYPPTSLVDDIIYEQPLICYIQVAGYIVEILEYHDVSGDFHKVQYNEEGGRVGR